MPGLLDDVIAIGGHALEVEDQQLREIYKGRGRTGGLLRTDYERYYQFIVWRSLLEKYDAQIEYGYEGLLVDLVIDHVSVPHLFEMKNWREETTSRISADVRRLRNFRGGGYLLVFSSNPAGMTRENLELLAKLDGINAAVCVHAFATENRSGKAYEFWFAGWQVSPATS